LNKTFAIVGPKVDIAHDDGAIDAFMASAIEKNPSLARDYQVRWIGLDDTTTVQIINFIKSGQKKATFTLPWVNKRKSWSDAHSGMPIVLLSTNGDPMLVVQVTEVLKTRFGAIDSSISGLDGPPVRDLDVWIKLHTTYWNEVLQEYGLVCCDDMPVHVEKFKLAYPL
tara:strand:- start:418 stop:921 length:504 start_codon:yes stop_codon:yes gene_type:complete